MLPLLRAGSPTLQETILSLLSSQAPLDARQLSESVSKHYRPVTPQALYKELRKLEARGVVVRSRGKYALHLTWVLDVSEWHAQLLRTYSSERYLTSVLPTSEHPKRYWYVSDLTQADLLWIQLSIIHHRCLGGATAFAWAPHAWFPLVHLELEERWMKAFERLGSRIYVIIGGRTFLDATYVKEWRTDRYHIGNAPGPFEGRNDIYFEVVGDAILSVHLDMRTVQRIEEYFNQIRKEGDLMKYPPTRLVSEKSRIRIQIEQNAIKAGKLRRKMEEYFGVK